MLSFHNSRFDKSEGFIFQPGQRPCVLISFCISSLVHEPRHTGVSNIASALPKASLVLHHLCFDIGSKIITPLYMLVLISTISREFRKTHAARFRCRQIWRIPFVRANVLSSFFHFCSMNRRSNSKLSECGALFS